MPQVATSKVATLCALLESLLLGKGGPDMKQVCIRKRLTENVGLIRIAMKNGLNQLSRWTNFKRYNQNHIFIVFEVLGRSVLRVAGLSS